MKKIKSLFITANPRQTARLSLDREFREIKAKIRSSEHRDSLELVSEWAVRPTDLLQYLMMHKPQIVHFSGHGSDEGKIILVDENDSPKAVPPEALQELFTVLKDNIRLVILNACYSQIQAQSIVKVIDCAIGMKDSISDEAAIKFISEVYLAIGFGRSIQEAFEIGRLAIILEGLSEEKIPDLLFRPGIDPGSIVFISKRSISEEYDQLLHQGLNLLKSRLYEQASQRFEQACNLDTEKAEAYFYLALATLAGRSFNSLYPKERASTEKHLRIAHAQASNWLLPSILLAILEIDYYNVHGTSSNNNISISRIANQLQNSVLSPDDYKSLAGIKISDEAKQCLGLRF